MKFYPILMRDYGNKIGQARGEGVELFSYVDTFFCSNLHVAVGHVSENTHSTLAQLRSHHQVLCKESQHVGCDTG